ncbi:MAG: type II toxin-antitoxin system PemK/MazF family toxin [Pseudomonadota bacterium]
MVSRFDVFLVSLDSTMGAEIQKTRPCVIISPDEINRFIDTIIIAPMTSKVRNYPTRIPLIFKEKKGQVVLDQLRTIDKIRLVTKLGQVNTVTAKAISQKLIEMFEY